MARTQEVVFPATGGTPIAGHFARPDEGDGPWPGVMVLHEVWGLNDDIRRITNRFADAGYAALAPDLYYLKGPKWRCIWRCMRDLQRGQGPTLIDLDYVRRYLVRRPDVDGDRVGVAGFCMGGGFALLYAVKGSVNATAPFYGDVPKRADDLKGVAPVVASYGGRDRMFAPKAERLKQHLTELGVPHDVKVYPECGHSFANDHTPGPVMRRMGAAGPMKVGFDPEAAEDAWSRVLTFFEEHLRG